MDAPRYSTSRSRLAEGGGADFASSHDVAEDDGTLRFDGRDDLRQAIAQARDYLLAEQHSDGHFCAELEGDSILESEYLLLLAWLRRETEPRARQLANELLHRQESHGGWAQFPGGPIDVSASVKAYLSLRLVGHEASEEPLEKARAAIYAAGGVEQVNSFTRYYLALLGIIGYHQVPAVPPELVLVPNWCPFNIHEMSAWSRTIVVPLSLLWAFQPQRDLPAEGLRIDEIFVNGPENLPVCMQSAGFTELAQVQGRRKAASFTNLAKLLDWERFFRGLDRLYKGCDRLKLLAPTRRLAIRKAERWMIERLADSDGLGAIFPPIIWSVVALRCLGRGEDDPLVTGQLHELEKLELLTTDRMSEIGERRSEQSPIPDSRSPISGPAPRAEPFLPRMRLQPCKSPVWDTAISTIALRECGLAARHPAVRQACQWLLEQERRHPGDWSINKPGVEPSGWSFEYKNAFYPDVDDTAMVLMALLRSLPASIERPWAAEFLLEGETDPGARNAAILAASEVDQTAACDDLAELSPIMTAIWRGVKWMLAMQGRDGGWGAFDADNTRWLFTKVPFADHNAMIDPSTSDLAARVVEMFGMLDAPLDHPAVKAAVDYVGRVQEDDGSLFGRWGVNYLYGTWQAILGYTSIGIDTSDPRITRAAGWLESVQQPCGGWGESPATYDDPARRGQGTPTASQTAWAVMGLVAAGQADSDSCTRGAQWLLDRQRDDGNWDEQEFTGTGFPQVFYLRYHYYRLYFPLIALARYERATCGE